MFGRMIKDIERHHQSNTESCKNLEQKFVFQIGTLRELVKTILHARDPLFGGQGKEETMGLSSWVGGYMRDHGSLKLGGVIYERTWVSQARWGDI